MENLWEGEESEITPYEIAEINSLPTGVEKAEQKFGVVKNKLLEIKSLDNQIKQLLKELTESETLSMTDLEKTYVIFSLNKIKLGLIFVSRLEKLIESQILIEDRIFDPKLIDQLSVGEILELNELTISRIDNYYLKINDILRNVDLQELENTILMLTQAESKNSIVEQKEEDSSIKRISLQILQSVSNIKSNNESTESR